MVGQLVSDALHLFVHLWKVHAEHGEQKGSTSDTLQPWHIFQGLGPSILRVRREPQPLSSVAGVTCELPGSWAYLWGCFPSAVPEVVPAALTPSLRLAAIICFPEVAWY